MEKTTISVLNNVKDDAIRNYRLFKWELVEEIGGLKETTLTFSRNDEVSYYKDLVKLENKFNRVYSIPNWIQYILVGIALVYVTTIMILWLTHVFTFDKSIIAIVLAVPTAVILLINVGISYLRNKQMLNHINNKEAKYKIYQEKVDQLINKSQN